MKNKLKRFILKVRRRVLAPLLRKLDEQDDIIRLVTKENLKNRAILKRQEGAAINVLFVCHEPALWSSFESIYQAMKNDSGFNPTIVVLPYRHSTMLPIEYKESKIAEFLQERGFPIVKGYDSENQKWKSPADFHPDYLFFQTPYKMFPSEWSAKQVSKVARVCYVPYACNIFGGSVDRIAHPPTFFENVSLVLKEGEIMRDVFVEKFRQYTWFDQQSVEVTGYPKLDRLHGAAMLPRIAKEKGGENSLQVLWTPRWRTNEGNCHFFEYKEFFSSYFAKHSESNFVFRPHPLCFQNFIKTGEMDEEEVSRMEAEYASKQNLLIDESGSYEEAFLKSDILVSDISSLLLEYFVTGKPIIYTHKVDSFNDLGQELAKGFYWVRNEAELNKTLTTLMSGEDPLRQIRQELIGSLFSTSREINAGARVKNVLSEKFASEGTL